MLKLILRTFLFSIITVFITNCSSDSDDPRPSCDAPPELVIDTIVAASSCNASDGEISVSVSQGGDAPFTFTLGNVTNESGQFTGLQPGTYSIVVEDAFDCTGEIEATVGSPDSDLAASVNTSADTECFSGNGSIELQVTGGEAPYQFDVGNGFVDNNTFTDLESGNYSIKVRDAAGCTISASATVAAGDTGTSFQDQIKPIFEANCILSNCHNGDLGPTLDFSKLENIQANADQVKSRTQSGDMPRGGLTLTEEEKALIACWVDEGAKNN